jgi:hypothetical protein
VDIRRHCSGKVCPVLPPAPNGQGGGSPAASIIPSSTPNGVVSLAPGDILVFIANWAREFARVRFRIIFSLDGRLAYFRSIRMRGSYRSSSSPALSSTSSASSDSDPDQAAGGGLQNRSLSSERAAAVVRRRIKLMGRQVVLVTLTVGGRRLRSWNAARRLMSGFVRLLRRRGLEGILGSSYVGVIEHHRDGCYHIHFACARGRFTQAELVLLRQVWTGYLISEGYELSPGTQFHRVHVAVRSSKWVSGYLAKYLTKGDLEAEERPAGVSRYIGSRDIACRQVLLDLDGFLRLLEGASKVEAYYLVDFGMVVGWCWWRDGFPLDSPAQPSPIAPDA